MSWLDNPQFKVAVWWAGGGILSLVGVVVPFLAMDGMNGGFAVSCLSGFFMILFGVGAMVYVYRAAVLNRILSGEDLVAHWTYGPEEWATYAKAEYERQKSSKTILFCVISGFALFFGLMFLVFAPKGGFAVFLTMMGLIVVIGFTAFLSVTLTGRNLAAGVGEAYIARAGVYLNRTLHTWTMMGATLDGVTLLRGESLLMVFAYSFPSKSGRQREDVRVPVPAGREEEAQRLVAYFNEGRPLETRGDEK